ncbi:hypothetical protein L6E12_02050 [Actinokineospora sp. PR83]|uniref:hypothetical protein n=1 Tax=Actinokineospora sp. PR83 TaxID=2884908 RepID=UPI001F26041F|nr:hypothetical protein [Actinokineospora sp. PR83]MCG8914578.1 hypothetical protein [Actinokineospora sp. PR83]
MRPEAFPAALYNTYITAVQRALAVEFTHRPQGQGDPSRPQAQAESPVHLAELPLEEFIARTRSRLDAIDAEYDAIRRREQAPPVATTEVRSPLGYLTMHVRDGGPIAIHGNPRALDNPSDTVLAEEALHLFARAGFGVEPDERPRPAARPRTGGDVADDEYFEGFKVLGKRGENG